MKRFLLLLTISLVGLLVYAQPSNDDCSSATSIPMASLDDGNGNCGAPLAGDNTDATPWEVSPGLFFQGNCWPAIDSVVFYSFTAQGVSGSVEVSNGPDVAHVSVIAFNGAACDGTNATEIGCAVGGPIVFDNDLVIGTTYYVVVGFANQAEGTFDLCVFNPEPAPNDFCVDATPIVNLDGTPCTSGQSNYYPSSENIAPACFGTATQSVWYQFVAQGVSIADLHIEGATANPNIAIWDFSGQTACDLANGVILDCQANAGTASPITLDNALTIGNTYYIEVTFENNATSNFDLCLDNPVPAFNDFCADAPVFPMMELNDSLECLTSVAGNPLNNDYASTDIGMTYGCWNGNATYNVWFQFTSQGPDVDIEVDAISFAEVEQIALIEFTGPACDPNNWVIWDCANGSELELNNTLDLNKTYHVVVGFSNNGVGDYCINIFNPEPPENDTTCAAINIPLNGTSTVCETNQTTTFANPELAPGSFPGNCNVSTQNTVWYTIQLSDPNNVGFEIDLQPITLSGQVSVVLFEDLPDCNTGPFSIFQFYCGPAPGEPLEFGPIDETAVYHVMIGTSEGGQGDFNLCISEVPPCFDNNYCEDPTGISSANDLGTPQSQSLSDCSGGGGPAFICETGCNLFADPEPGLTACLAQQDPVVWYTFTTDAIANILNLSVTSSEISAPSIQLWLSNDGTCNDLTQVGLTQNGFSCMTGSGGEVIANSTPVSASATYYVAVSGANTVGGDFEICISTLEATAACVTNSSIEVTDRSFAGPLEGPYFPGETVSLCLNVTTFTVSTGTQNCQWFQGISPVFGNGWDPASFDANGQPLNATMNGQAFPANNVHNGGQFDWWVDVTYHHPHCFYNVGDFDGNGTLDMCNGLYDQDCTGPGLQGGCCASCWNTEPGALLPPGWFTSGVTGLCGMDGHPTWDWGDGNTCNGATGPWMFCFDLMVREYPDCDQDESTMDLSVGFVSFADGEVGSWNGGPSVCGADEPLFQKLPGCCTELAFEDEEHPPLCEGGVFSWLLDNPNADFWQWTVDAPATVVGWSDGSGPNGTSIIDNLTNTGTTSEIITYNFLGFQGGECPSVQLTVTVEVLADIEVSMDPFTACATPTDPYVLEPMVEGGDPDSYMFNWHDGSADPTFEISNPQPGQQYAVTVSDASGCSGTASVVLQVYSTFPVDISGPVTEQCVQDGEISLSATASGGLPGYDFSWTGPGGVMLDGSDISVEESGQWLVQATDSEGCVGKDSVQLLFHEAPEVSVTPENVAVCPDNPTAQQILALVEGGEGPYQYEWTTPIGVNYTSFILVEEAGSYNIMVTDVNGCTVELAFDVEEAPSPDFDLGGPETVCPEDLASGYTIQVPDDPSYFFYDWSNSEETQAITVYEPGNYEVTVTNAVGCQGTSEFVLDVHPPISTSLPDTVFICAGNFGVVDAGPGFVEYVWSTNDVGQEIFVFDEELIFLTVTDANGCTAEDEVQIIEDEFLAPDIIGDSVICNGVPVDIMAIGGFETYEWSTEEETETITVSAGGWYYLTVSDGDGCFGVDSVLVLESAPDPGIAGEPAICDGESTTLDVGSWDEIQWSTGETTPTITADTAGTYSVTITDQYGCVSATSLDVVVSNNPTPDITGPNSFCLGGMSTLDAGGGYASYLWSNDSTSQTIDVATPGTYTVTVTNSAGCTGTDMITVTEETALTPDIQGETVICGAASVQLDAGGGYTAYSWSTTDDTQVITVSTGGTFVVTVTDAMGCTGTDEVIVQQGDPDPEITGAQATCEGGSETLTTTAGFVSYLWSTTETTESITADASGTYSVTVTDDLGCTAEATFDFTVNPNPTPTINGSTTFCTGGSTELTAPAGFSYTWTGGATGQSVVIDVPGDVFLTVTDANGCTGTAMVTVTESTELMLNVSDEVICEGDVATLSVGTFANYMWSTSETSATIDVSTSGTYSVTVSDSQGCTGSADIEVTVNPQPFAEVTASATTCNTTEDGSTIDFSTLVTGGDTGGTWTETTIPPSDAAGSFPNLDFAGVPPGVYTFRYTTNSAIAPCEDVSYPVLVTVMDCACPSPLVDDANPLCTDDGVLDLSELFNSETQPGGTWSIVGDPGGSNPATLAGTIFDATGADPGTYTVAYVITGIPDGCPDRDSKEIVVNSPPDAGFAAPPAQVCVGEDSSIMLDALVTDGDGGGMWVETSIIPSTGGAFDAASGVFRTGGQEPATYTFEYVLTGTVPCPDASTTVEVVVEDVPVADAGEDLLLTCETPESSLDGTGSSTGSDFEYIWSTMDGELTGDPTDLNMLVSTGGTYTLIVRNRTTGCESMDDVFVDVADDLPTGINYDLALPTCEGDPPGRLEVIAVTGGTGPYMYSLNGAAFTTNTVFSDLGPGDYTLRVEDSNGCAYQRSFNIPAVTGLEGVIVGDAVIVKGNEATFTYLMSEGIADSVIWYINGVAVCTNCDTLTFLPDDDAEIGLIVFDAAGCSVDLAATLVVRVERNVYVPNVFSPNDDGHNDFVTIFSGSDVKEIEVFRVYTRWGEVVFENEHFPHNVPTEGWDGTFGGEGGEVLSPGVYVYQAVVVYSDDITETLKGDITLVR